MERYPHIPAPFERTIVEAAFYRAVRDDVPVASRMPALLHVDEPNHVIALEDIGAGGDCTSIYAGDSLEASTLSGLLDWLAGLAAVPISSDGRAAFHNRAMRALNHDISSSFRFVRQMASISMRSRRGWALPHKT